MSKKSDKQLNLPDKAQDSMRGVTCVLSDIFEMLKESGVTSLTRSFHHLKIYITDVESELEKLKITKDTARKIDMNTADCALLKARFQALKIDRELNEEKIEECRQKINDVEQKYAELSDEQRRSNDAYQAEIAEINKTYKVEIVVLYGKIEKQNEVIAQLQDMLQRGYEDAEKAAKSVNQGLIEEIQKIKRKIRDLQNEREYRKDIYSSQMQDDTVIVPEFEVVAASAHAPESVIEKKPLKIEDNKIDDSIQQRQEQIERDWIELPSIADALKRLGDKIIIPPSERDKYVFSTTNPENKYSLVVDHNISEKEYHGQEWLLSVLIQNGVKYIGSFAFFGGKRLIRVYIPESVEKIGDSAFGGCSNYLIIYCQAKNKPSNWSESWNPDNCLVVWDCCNKSQKNAEKPRKSGSRPQKNSNSAEHDSDTPRIIFNPVEFAIENCVLKSYFGRQMYVTIPDGVTGIGSFAFRYYYDSNRICNRIKMIPSLSTSFESTRKDQYMGPSELMIPNSVIFIEYSALFGCSRLAKIIYKGTKSQWRAIKKDDGWNYNTGNYTVHCTNGDIIKRADNS